MRKLILFLLLAGIALPVFAIRQYKAGDKLYVLAANGLSLREGPDISNRKLANLKHGAVLTVLAEDLLKYPFAITEFSGYEIEGHWVKVQTWDDKTGYVFDGYLSRYQAPKKVLLTDHLDPKYVVAEQYLMVHSKRKGKPVKMPVSTDEFTHYKQVFQNGATVEVNTGAGYASYSIVFDKITSFEEAYLIGRAMWFNGKPARVQFQDEVITMSDKEHVISATVSMNKKNAMLTLVRAD